MQLPPIYSETYHMTLLLMQTTAKFPRPYRPTIGQKMEKAGIELLVRLRVALLSQHRTDIKAILPFIDELKVLLQLSYDLQLISHHGFASLSEKVIVVGKMLGGMWKSQKPHSRGPQQEAFQN
jgi:hypothetical protein